MSVGLMAAEFLILFVGGIGSLMQANDYAGFTR